MVSPSRNVLSPACIARVYKACVRSIMEYASPVWNGAPLYVLRSLDALQRKCQRMFPDISLESLQLRRDVAGLSIIHQATHGKCPTPASNTFLKHGFYQPTRLLRSSTQNHPFTIRQVVSSYYFKTLFACISQGQRSLINIR